MEREGVIGERRSNWREKELLEREGVIGERRSNWREKE